jgi:S1-C subfamily serine protease
VTPGSPADDAGIRQGDVLRKVGGHAVEDAADYRRVAEQFKDRESPIPFLVERDRTTQFYAVKPRL